MADIRLDVGIDVGASYKSMREDLNGIVSALNKQPKKVRVDLDLAYISKDVNALKSQLTDIQTQASGIKVGTNFSSTLGDINGRLNDIAQSLNNIGTSNGFNGLSNTIGTLKSELASLSAAMKSFQGINLNLGLNSGNAISRNTAYGMSARAGIQELTAQANAMERLWSRALSISNQREAAMRAISSTVGANAFYSTTDRLGVGNLTEQMTALRDYIALMQRAASMRGLDITPLTSQFSHTADEIIQSTQKVASGEQELEVGVEKLKSLFGSGINSEALGEQLTNIQTAINGVTEAISKIGLGSNAITEITQKIELLIAAVNSINTALQNITPVREVVDPSALQEVVEKTQAESAAAGQLGENVSQLKNIVETYISDIKEEKAQHEEQAAAARKAANAAKEKREEERAAAQAAKERAAEEKAAEKAAAQAAREQAAAQKEAAQRAAATEQALKRYRQALVLGEGALQRWTAAERSRNHESRAAYESLQKSVNAMRAAKAAYDNGSGSIGAVSESVARFRAQLKDTEFILKHNGDATKSWSDRLGNLAQKFGAWLSVSQVIMRAIRVIRQMISESIELDSAMTQMQIVTKASTDEMEKFGDAAVEAAQKTATSVTDIIDSATTYARLGYSMPDATTLAEYTAMLQNVGDIDVEDAQNAITAIIKAFDDISASNIEEVMDKLVETGNNFPISVSQIAEGMNNASSTLAAAGNSFEQSVALLTAANTTIQNAAKSSTGLRTIAARIRNTKTELDELGETMTEANYQELVSTLTKAGVSLTDINNNYRSTYDIMSDIAAKWSEMSNMEQAALATALSGTRQQAVFYSIIEQFQEAQGAMDAMTHSAGALTDAYDTYLDSAQAHINQFKAVFQQLSKDFMKSDFLKDIVDLGAGILKILNGVTKVINVLGGLKSILYAIAAIIVTIKADAISTALFVTLPAKIGALIALFGKLRTAISVFITMTAQMRTATAGAIVPIGQSTSALGRMSAALKAVGISASTAQLAVAAFMVVLTAGLIIYNKVKEAQQKAAAEAEELNRKQLQAAQTAENERKELAKLASQYFAMADAVSAGTASKEDLISLQDKVIESLGLERAEIEELVKQYGSYKEAIRQASLEKFKEQERDARSGLNAAKTNALNAAKPSYYDNVIADTQGTNPNAAHMWNNEVDQANIDANKKAIEALSDLGFEARYGLGGSTDYISIILGDEKDLETIEGVIDAYRRLKTAMDTVSESAGSENDVYELLDNQYQSIKEDAEEYLSQINNVNEALVEQQVILNKDSDNPIDNRIDFAKYKEGIEQAVIASNNFAGTEKDVAAAVDNVLSKDIRFQQFYTDVANTEQPRQGLEELKKKFDELKTSLDTARSAFSTVAAAVKEFNENGVLSSDTLSKLLALEPEYLNLLVDENGQLNLNTESYEQLIKAKLQNMLLNQMDSTIESIMKMGVEEAAAYAAAEAYDAETDSIYELIAAKMRLALSDAKDKDAANGTDVYTKAIMRMGRTFEPMAVMIDNYSLASENAASSTNKSTSATNANTDALKEQKSALEESKKALEDYKNDLTDAQSSIKALTDLVQEYIKAQKDEEKKALQERKENFDDLIAKEKEELQVKKEAAEFEKTLREKQNTVAKDALAASIASLDNSSAGRKSQKETADALIKSRGDLQETLADHEYDILVKALDELQKKNDEYYDKQIEKIDEYLSNTRQIYEDACRMIENDTGDLYGKLWEYTYRHTTKTKAEFDKMWSDAQNALERYGVAQNGVIGIMEILQGEIYNTESQINNVAGAIDTLNSRINNAANDSLSNFHTQMAGVRDEYERLMRDLEYEVAPKWYDWYRGKRYESSFEDFDSAVHDIIAQIQRDHGVYKADTFGSIKHYAGGTMGAPGGLAVVGERGAELEVMNRGNGVLTNKITRGLAALGSNPAQFIADASAKLLNSMRQTNRALIPAVAGVNGNQSVPINFSYVINGDVNPQTLRELKKYHQQTVKEAVNTMMSKTLGWRNSSRVR